MAPVSRGYHLRKIDPARQRPPEQRGPSQVEPIPETAEAIDELDAYAAGEDLLDQLVDMGARVRDIVPDCVGMSLAYVDQGVTFTLVATDAEIATLDGVQYLGGGPCVDAVAEAHLVETDRDDLMDEGDWQLFGQATAAAAVASTLTMPIMHGETAVGSINLYGASSKAFAGHHEELAEIFHAWAPGAVTNADLSFHSRTEAEKAPKQVEEQARIDTATGIIAARQGVDVDTARERLTEAALRAGVQDAQLAKAVIDSHAMNPTD
jgi:transcriptional regulator with GAF, ATPase, and Fis domain